MQAQAAVGDVVREDRELPRSITEQYPFHPNRMTLPDGVRMNHVDEGAGEPVLFVHGNPTWSFLWRHFIPAVKHAGFRAIAPDHVGFGRSDKPRDPTYYTLDRHVANLTALVDTLDLRDVTLVVHDWGGPIGLGWATKHAERVKRVVVMNTAAFAPQKERPFTKWHAVFSSRAGDLLGVRANLIMESAMRFGVHDRKGMTRPILGAYRWPMKEKAAREAALAFVRSVPNGPSHANTPRIREIQDGLANLKDKPAILLWGDADPVFGKGLIRKWQDALPGLVDVKRYERGGHFLQEDVSDRIGADLVNFLQTTK